MLRWDPQTGQKDKEHANRAEEDMKRLLGLFMAAWQSDCGVTQH